MRDVTSRRRRIDVLRSRLLAVWAAPVFDVQAAADVLAGLRTVLNEDKKELVADPLLARCARVAVTVACAPLRADPEAVLRGELDKPGGKFATSRARAYAGLALRAVMEDHNRRHIAAAIGVAVVSQQTYFSSLDHRFSNAGASWWDEATFMQVIHAIEAEIERDKAEHVGK